MTFWLNLVYWNLESGPNLFWASFLKKHNSRSALLHNNDYSLAIFKTGAIAVSECGKLTFLFLGTWTVKPFLTLAVCNPIALKTSLKNCSSFLFFFFFSLKLSLPIPFFMKYSLFSHRKIILSCTDHIPRLSEPLLNVTHPQ